jgi:hypothetical protein
MHTNTYRLGSMTCVNMDAPQETEELKNIYYITLRHLDQHTYVKNFKSFKYFKKLILCHFLNQSYTTLNIFLDTCM